MTNASDCATDRRFEDYPTRCADSHDGVSCADAGKEEEWDQ